MHLPLLLTSLLLASAEPPSATSRYVRLEKGKPALESVISFEKTPAGPHYKSVTHRPGVKLELAIQLGERGEVRSARVTLHGEGKKTLATVRYLEDEGQVLVERPGAEGQKLALAVPPVLVTSAPDWSDILLLLRLYDGKRGGKQEFMGVWAHPLRPAHLRTFVVERLGTNTIKVDGAARVLGRHRVLLRSGGYLVWADAAGLVYKLMPTNAPQAAVYLEGHEQATQDLR